MPFCPKCRAEYRAGFTLCKPCGSVALVDELPSLDEISEEERPTTVQAGLSSLPHVVEIGGRQIDLSRLFLKEQAEDIREAIAAAGLPSLMVPIADSEFPDRRVRFEVRVRPGDLAGAEAVLQALWKKGIEDEGMEHLLSGSAVDVCPACGGHVPLDVEECPECGLVIGTSEPAQDEAST